MSNLVHEHVLDNIKTGVVSLPNRQARAQGPGLGTHSSVRFLSNSRSRKRNNPPIQGSTFSFKMLETRVNRRNNTTSNLPMLKQRSTDPFGIFALDKFCFVHIRCQFHQARIVVCDLIANALRAHQNCSNHVDCPL